MEKIKIISLKVENVKRVRAVYLEPSPQGMTVIGGNNGEGKTSILDAIIWTLGGNRYKPSSPQREDSVVPPNIHIELNNGIVVTRDGKNGDLKVIDSSGNKAGQALLDEMIGQLALDLPKFLTSTSSQKAMTLLQIIGVGDQLHELQQHEDNVYTQRHEVGIVALRKKKHAEDLPFIQDAPAEEVSVSELIQQQQEILGRNGENLKLRERFIEVEREHDDIDAKVKSLVHELEVAREKREEIDRRYGQAIKTVEQIADESTAEIEASLLTIDETNKKVRINAAKKLAENESAELQEQYEVMTEEIETVRKQRMQLLEGADLPLPELSIEKGKLIYEGHEWDCMASSKQLRVAVAIVRRLKPDCGFVLLDKTEQMDVQTLLEFGEWLKDEGLQVIATRVSTGDECSIIIEDGLIRNEETQRRQLDEKVEGGF